MHLISCDENSYYKEIKKEKIQTNCKHDYGVQAKKTVKVTLTDKEGYKIDDQYFSNFRRSM